MTQAYLGVETSLTGRRWAGPTLEQERQAEAIAQQTGLPPALCQTLARLGQDAESAAAYLSPSLRDLLPDPRRLKDVEQAAGRLRRAAERGERVAIFADYDVDGAASGALMHDWLAHFGLSSTLYVPDRIDEGYGPNEDAMRDLAAAHDLIVCVDCGTLSHGPIAAATGADVLVLDHHQGGESLPPALAVVNPNRQDESGDLGHLCAAGVVFLALVEANRQMRDAHRNLPDLVRGLDLVALATVADVAPLVGVNRAFVQRGLEVIGWRERPGLVALSAAARLNGPVTAHSLGYVLGPRINAGGRVGRADLGLRLLTTRDAAEAGAIADRLEALNSERRAVEDEVRLAALAQAEARGLEAPLVWAAGEGWHPGVVGIVASRLKEEANRPAIVIGLDGDEGKGSGRSVSGIDLGALIARLVQEGLLLKGGGHKMAAGLTVARDRLEEAMDRLGALIARQAGGRLDAPRLLRLDGTLMPAAATPELVRQIDQAGPYGAGAPAPRLALPAQNIQFAREVGTGHLKLRVGAGGHTLDAIAYGAVSTPLGAALMQAGGRPFHLAGRLEINHWQGRQSVQLRLEDAAPAQP